MWTPNRGLYSIEDFSSPSGFSGISSQQTVTGGFAALIPQVNGSVSYFHPWSTISGWQVNNGMSSETAIKTDFTISGAYVDKTNDSGVLPSGYQRLSAGGGSWEIYTPPITTGAAGNSGQVYQYVSLNTGSPNGHYFSGASAGNPFTIEFDVASTVQLSSSGLTPLPTGTLTGLTPLTGILNHGIYISNGTNWDYLEVRPDGIRSFNHPELQLPISLQQPQRFRVGIRNQDLFILSDNGAGVAGLGKFNTTDSIGGVTDAQLAFGAPHTGQSFAFDTDTVISFVGRSYWDNIKVLTGELALEVGDKLQNNYSTSAKSMYTPVFDAGVGLERWLNADVEYVHYAGGTTTITPMYYGTGHTYVEVGGAAVVLEEGATHKTINMSAVPAGTIAPIGPDGIKEAGRKSPTNKIRFKITQVSTDGTGPAPIVDSIFVKGVRDASYLDLIPNWKTTVIPTQIQMIVETGAFLSAAPKPRAYTELFIAPPTGLGRAAGTLTDLSTNGHTVTIVGTGESVAGKYATAFQNFNFGSGRALSGTHASDLFGLGYRSNLIPDPMFELPFKDVTALTGYATGLVGEIGYYLEVPVGYTGQALIDMRRHSVLRESSFNTTGNNYAQSVELKTVAPDESCGVEAVFPSGMSGMSGTRGIFAATIKITEGSGITLYSSGAFSSVSRNFDSVWYTDYSRIAVPIDIVLSGEGRIGIVSQAGTKSSFILDDLTFTPLNEAYLTCENVSLPYRPFGSLYTGYPLENTGSFPPEAYRASTIASCDMYLSSYPTGNNNTIIRFIPDDGSTPIDISMTTGGYPRCQFKLCENSVYTGDNEGGTFGPGSDNILSTISITGASRIPLGVWTNVGFIHQSHVSALRGGRALTGQEDLYPVAVCNKAYLTIDGLPVASQDTHSGWIERGIEKDVGGTVAATTLPTFICTGIGDVVAASGMYCAVDNIQISRPPVADAESTLYIEYARAGVPYFIPDVMLKPGHINQASGRHAISYTTTGDTWSPGAYALSIYTLDNPRSITVWDHGATRNHLMCSGDVYKQTGLSPYSGFGSTRFSGNGYGKSPYSSSVERLINYTGNWDVYNVAQPYPIGNGKFYFGSWLYPRATGVFMEMPIDDRLLAGSRLELDLFNQTGIKAARFDNTNTAVAYTTGYFTGEVGSTTLNTWVHVGLIATTTFWNGHGTTGSLTLNLFLNGVDQGVASFANGVDYGFRYEGNSQQTGRSAFIFGRGMDCNMADVFLCCNPLGTTDSPVLYSLAADNTGNKGGTYNKVYYGTGEFTGTVSYSTFKKAYVNMPATNTPKSTMLWAGVNEYFSDEGENLEGYPLYPSVPFQEVKGYTFIYDDSAVRNVFGSTDSPIRLGLTVPGHAINIARVDVPEHTVGNSITTIDLSDSNPNNLSSFRGGQFSLLSSQAVGTTRESSGSFKNINAGYYVGQSGVTFLRQADTDDLEITSLSVAGIDNDQPTEAYYAYLLGGGDKAISVPGAFPHNTTGIGPYTTGNLVDKYVNNLERAYKFITIRTSNGLPIEDFKFDIITSPFTARDLSLATRSGLDIPLDSIHSGTPVISGYTGLLPNGIFSVVMYSPIKPSAGDTIWIHYPAYNLENGSLNTNHREIYNPIPIMRESFDFQTPVAGQYTLQIDNDNQRYYNVTVHGVHSGYTGNFL